MHEFSLATEVIKLAQNEAEKRMAHVIKEITIEIGHLSGVEAGAFESALELLVNNTILDKARLIIIETPGKGMCNECKSEFEMKNRIDTCPACKCFPSEISGGVEFRVVSLIVE